MQQRPTSLSARLGSRSRLDAGDHVYGRVLALADALDADGQDLWAAGLRTCLDAGGSTRRQRHMAAELTRLRDTTWARRSGNRDEIDSAIRHLEVALGRDSSQYQPLYEALRELSDHLELNGGRRWLKRLRTVVLDPERDAPARLERLATVLAHMEPGVEGLPEGSAQRVRAVRSRLGRHTDIEEQMLFVRFALRGPAASRVKRP